MLTIVTGLPGNGKTLYTIWHCKKYLESENKERLKNNEAPRAIYYHNINGLTLDWQHLENIEEWNDCPKGSIIVVDEAQTFFPPMQNGAVRPPFYMDFATHRHKGYDIFLITQNATLIDFKVRTMCGHHVHMSRSMGLPASTVYKFPTVQNTSNDFYKTADNVVKEQWRFPKEVYEYYKSAEVHTHKVKLPWFKFAGIAAALALTLAMFMYVFDRFSPENYGGEVLEESRGRQLEIISASTTTPDVSKDDLVPQIAGLPSSAPIYRNQFAVTAAPRVDGCSLYQFGNTSQCFCNDQRGNIVDTPYDFCKVFVEKGFFDFTVRDSDYERGQGTAVGVPPRNSSENSVFGISQN